MAGDDLTLGNLGVRGAAVFGPSTFSVTGIYAIRFSTYVPNTVGSQTGIADRVPSTNFTFSTNDILAGITPPGFTTSILPQLNLCLFNGFPTSSGGFAFQWINVSTVLTAGTTGTYTVTVFRTT